MKVRYTSWLYGTEQIEEAPSIDAALIRACFALEHNTERPTEIALIDGTPIFSNEDISRLSEAVYDQVTGQEEES